MAAGGRAGDVEIDALLCDHAQVAGKLFISGANIDVFNIPPATPGPYLITFAVGGVVHVPWTETNQEHRLRFSVVDADGRTPALPPGTPVPPGGIGGEMVFNVGRPPGLPDGEEQLVPFAFQFVALPLAELGRYSIRLSIDGTEVRRVAFRLAKPPEPQSYGPTSFPLLGNSG